MFQKKLKRLGACLLTFSLAFGAVQFPAIQASASESENIARDATPTASGTEADTLDASKAIDGDKTSKSSRWSSANNTGPAWIQLQWDTSQTMKNICIYWERRNVENYRLEISDDGNDWETVWSNPTYPTKNNEVITLEEAKTAAYLRLYIGTIHRDSVDSSETPWQTAAIYEIEVYEDEVSDGRSEVQKILEDKIAAPSIKDGKVVCNWVDEEEQDVTVRIISNYEQVVGNDGTIYTPIADKTVIINYEVTKNEETLISAPYELVIPGAGTAVSDANEKPEVIPELQEWRGKTGNFLVSATSRIIVNDQNVTDLESVAKTFAENYKDVTGMDIAVKSGNKESARMGDFYITLGSEDLSLGKEGYRLDIDDVTVIEAVEPTGAHWGTMSVLQILKQTKGLLPKGYVRDYPKYEVRAFSLDVGRKPFTLDTLYTFMKNMSWYKMNSFQIHLSDNLIFFEDYPTQDDAIDQAYGGMRLESGVVSQDGNTATAEDVYYTKDEFRAFILDSRSMGVDIVPEFDMPAHAWPFMKAFPEYRTKLNVSNGSRYRIDELDLSNPETTEWAKSIWNDYFEGENPVFDEEMTVHVGTDEYHGTAGQAGIEEFRKFSDDMIKFVQQKGRKVRMWGSLSNKTGTTDVKSENVQLNIWNTEYADPQAMYDLGFDLINTLEGPNYIVPAAGYYNDYINAQSIYNNWKPNVIGNLSAAEGDDQILGGCYAIWHDSVDTRANGISEYDSFDRFFSSSSDKGATIAAYSSKLWGDSADRTYAELVEVVSQTGTAPNADMYAEVDTISGKIVEYTFDGTDMKEDSSGNGYDLSAAAEDAKNVGLKQTEDGKALELKGGESYVTTPLNKVSAGSVLTMKVKKDAGTAGEQILCESKDEFGIYGTYAFKAVQRNTGKVGFSREGYDYSFDYTLPENEWVELKFESGQNGVSLYVDGELQDNNPEIRYANHETVELSETLSGFGITKIDTMLVPIGRIGSTTNSFKGQIEFVMVSNSKSVEAQGEYGVIEQGTMSATACSTSSREGSLDAMLDGDSSTYWHQDYDNDTTVSDEQPHWITLTFKDGNTRLINKLSYLPRQDSANGRIYRYGIEVTLADGQTKEVARGIWAKDSSKKTAEFDPVEAVSVTLNIYESEGNHATAAELNLYEPLEEESVVSNLRAELNKYVGYQEKDYTDVSWLAFENARILAQKVLENENHSVEECLWATEQLAQAAGNLTEKPLANKLVDIINQTEELLENTSGYTPSSVAELKLALSNALSVLQNGDATQEDLNAALKSLHDIKLENNDTNNTPGDGSTPPGNNPGGNVPVNKPDDTVLAIGKEVTVATGTYRVTNAANKEVTLIKGEDAKNVTIPATVLVEGVDCKVVGIGNNAFKGSKKLTKLVIGDNVTTIGDTAFSASKKLTQVTIGKNVTTIGKKAFFNCKKLKKVTVKGTAIKKIGAKALKGTNAKITVKLPKMKTKQKNALKKLLKTAKISSKAKIK